MINTDGKVFKLGQCGLEPVKSLTGDQLQVTAAQEILHLQLKN